MSFIRKSSLRLTAAASVVLALVALPAGAHASATQLSIMQDDNTLLYKGDNARDAALRRMKALGVDAVRVTVLWSVVTDGLDGTPKSKAAASKQKAALKRFHQLGEDNPKAYPKGNWDRYDRLARACKATGIICYFDVTGPGPSFSHPKPPAAHAKDAKWWEPNATHFANFVKAVGKRFSGTYADENDNHQLITRVSLWSLWNEPNQGGWLRPQFLNGKPQSPKIYRQLYLKGRKALDATGHGNDVILAGETAPAGVARKTTTSAMGPKQFINELLCGAGSTGAGCGDFDKYGPLRASGWAHHPYTKKLPPNVPDTANPDSITLANINDLGALLDKDAAHVKNTSAAPQLPIFSTEFGYETNPPDPTASTTLQQQAQFDTLGEYLTSTNPRIEANTQFLLFDVPPDKHYSKGSRNYWATYQSGLFGSTGAAKPAASAYPLPFLALPNSPTVTTIWGQLRFLPNTISTAAPQTVQIQYLQAGTAAWINYGDPVPVTNTMGYFSGQLPRPGAAGLFRAVGPGNIASPPVTVP